MEDILIDTDIVIEYLRSTEKSSTELIKLLQKYDVLLSSISEFELYLGAKTERHQNDLEENREVKDVAMAVKVAQTLCSLRYGL